MDNVKFVDRINLSLKSRHISKGKFYEESGFVEVLDKSGETMSDFTP